MRTAMELGCVSENAYISRIDNMTWNRRRLTAKCLVPTAADFAVIQLAARPDVRPANLEGIFADDVRLTLKTSPQLPIRLVHR